MLELFGFLCDFEAAQSNLALSSRAQTFLFSEIRYGGDKGFGENLALAAVARVVAGRIMRCINQRISPKGLSGVFFSCGIGGIFPIIISAKNHGSITTMS